MILFKSAFFSAVSSLHLLPRCHPSSSHFSYFRQPRCTLPSGNARPCILSAVSNFVLKGRVPYCFCCHLREAARPFHAPPRRSRCSCSRSRMRCPPSLAIVHRHTAALSLQTFHFAAWQLVHQSMHVSLESLPLPRRLTALLQLPPSALFDTLFLSKRKVWPTALNLTIFDSSSTSIFDSFTASFFVVDAAA